MTTEINPERRAHELQEAEELLQERTEMLFDACWALDCLNFFEPLEDNKHDGLHLLRKELGTWWQAEVARRDAHYAAQEQKYRAAMREKRLSRLRLVK